MPECVLGVLGALPRPARVARADPGQGGGGGAAGVPLPGGYLYHVSRPACHLPHGPHGISRTDCSAFSSCNTLLWYDLFTQLCSIILPRKHASKGVPAYFRMSLFGVVPALRFCFRGTQPITIFQLQFILWFNNIPTTLALSLDFPIMLEPQEHVF